MQVRAGELGFVGRTQIVFGISLVVAIVNLLASTSTQLHFSPSISVRSTALGLLQISARPTGENAEVVVRGSSGRILHSEEFRIVSYEGGQGIAFRSLTRKGLPQPIVVAVAHQVGADGVNTEVALLAPVRGKVRNIWSGNREFRFSQEGLCVGALGGKHGQGVAEFRMIEGSDCVVCPHQYSVTVSSWSLDRLVRRATLQTSTKHDDASRAAQELGFACEDVITSTVLDAH